MSFDPKSRNGSVDPEELSQAAEERRRQERLRRKQQSRRVDVEDPDEDSDTPLSERKRPNGKKKHRPNLVHAPSGEVMVDERPMPKIRRKPSRSQNDWAEDWDE